MLIQNCLHSAMSCSLPERKLLGRVQNIMQGISTRSKNRKRRKGKIYW